jgi:hypothetical protein
MEARGPSSPPLQIGKSRSVAKVKLAPSKKTQHAQTRPHAALPPIAAAHHAHDARTTLPWLKTTASPPSRACTATCAPSSTRTCPCWTA